MRIFNLLPAIALFFGCQPQPDKELQPGTWRAVVEIQGQQLPFNLEVEESGDDLYRAYILNAGERLLLDEIRVSKDSVEMVLHIFDATFKAALLGDSLKGHFVITYAQDYRLPFFATANQPYRFAPRQEVSAEADFSGKYEVQFFNESSISTAVGIFEQQGNYVEGTFLTPTGDYRYLEGNVVNDTLHLSTFDGNHIYLFRAVKENDSTLQGVQWLGKSRSRKWTGVHNDNAQPPESETLTYLKEGYDQLDFSFPDINGNQVSAQDARFKDKVVVIQIMGTWCPNCMDETKFLADWYPKNKARGVDIIGLAYEQKADFEYARSRVNKMKEKLKVPYDILIAGEKDNAKASETLPALNRVIAFPTTIFVGKDGKVKHIHTGFSGPGTGVYYEQQKERFNEIVNQLVSGH
jgi:peroxiredoxin